MRAALTMLILLICFTGRGQELPVSESGKVTFTGVVDVEGKSKSQLFRNAQHFFETNYKSSSTLKSSDSESGKLEGSSFLGWDGIQGKVKYDLTIIVKDGKYKYLFSHFSHHGSKGKCSGAGLDREEPKCGNGGKMSKKTWGDIKAGTIKSTEELIEKLALAMQLDTREKKETDDF